MNRIIMNCYYQICNKLNLGKHIKIALVVGIVLNIINQFDFIIHLQFQNINYLKASITFFVPFAVSVYSAATIKNIEYKND